MEKNKNNSYNNSNSNNNTNDSDMIEVKLSAKHYIEYLEKKLFDLKLKDYKRQLKRSNDDDNNEDKYEDIELELLDVDRSKSPTLSTDERFTSSFRSKSSSNPYKYKTDYEVEAMIERRQNRLNASRLKKMEIFDSTQNIRKRNNTGISLNISGNEENDENYEINKSQQQQQNNNIQISRDGNDVKVQINEAIQIISNQLENKQTILLSPTFRQKPTINNTNNIKEKSSAEEVVKSSEFVDTLNSILASNEQKREQQKCVNINKPTIQDEKKMKPSPNKNNSMRGARKGCKLRNLLDNTTRIDRLHYTTKKEICCDEYRCEGSLMAKVKPIPNYPIPKEELKSEAIEFINSFYASVKREGSKNHKERIEEITQLINNTGTYDLKESELNFAAKTAWRNSSKCIGRIQWNKLQVFDARYVTTARGMFEAICNHIRYSTNKGNIRSAITVFRQRTNDGPEKDFRIWNGQFFNYAGYKIGDDKFIGDKAQIEFTEVCIKLGWTPKMTEFEMLPLVLQANGQDPEWFTIPSDIIMEVDIVHPDYEWFKDLKLKWYAVPGVATIMLDAGGIEFTATPFNGWYMGTEVGRNISDVDRLNKLIVKKNTKQKKN
jgi:nitric oxide synthase oxygenase domain/subunit